MKKHFGRSEENDIETVTMMSQKTLLVAVIVVLILLVSVGALVWEVLK
ncbi:hypothetical protein BH10PSE7_BH10PSE7_33190 [soil metagenome]